MTKTAHSYIVILCYRLIDLFSCRLLTYIKEFKILETLTKRSLAVHSDKSKIARSFLHYRDGTSYPPLSPSI